MFTSLIVLVLFMILTAMVLERAIQKRMLQAEEDKLQAIMYSILAAVDRDDSGLSITVADGRLFESALFATDSGLYVQLFDAKREIWRSLSTVDNFPKPDLAIEELRFDQLPFNGKPWFQLGFSIHWPNIHDKLSLYNLVLWKDASDYFAQFTRFRQTLWLWLILTIALLLVVMWLVMLWSLRPLRLIGEEVRSIEEGKKDRFDSTYPSEIKPLTQNLNLLLQREQHQMLRYRHALDDLAHSLKTPLAVLRGLSEKNEWREEDGITLAEQNQRMDQIVSYQLQKAATVGGQLMAKPINFKQLLEKTVNALKKAYQDKQLNIELRVENTGEIRLDESDLLELLGNLIDNACKYCQKQVSIHARLDHNSIRLTIEDDGPGLEKKQLDKIFKRGARLDQTQEGQGIGLAMVNEIVMVNEIGLEFGSSDLGGLRATLIFGNV